MTVIVTGGRDFSNRDLVYRVLDSLKIEVLIQGGATGADWLAKEWAQDRGVYWESYMADWDSYGLKAGPIRNGKMLSAHPTAIVVAFKGNKGTKDCVTQAKGLGMTVLTVS